MWKEAQHHYSLEKWKLNPQYDITTHILTWLKLRSDIPNGGENVGQLELSYDDSWDIKFCDYLGKHFGNFLNVKHIPTLRFFHFTFRYLSKEMRACTRYRFLCNNLNWNQLKYASTGEWITNYFTFIQWNTTEQYKGTNYCYAQLWWI